MVHGCLSGWVSWWKCVHVCLPDHRFIQFALASCYAVHINALSIERSTMQVELIRFLKKKIEFIHVYVCKFEESNAISLTETNSRELQQPDSVCCHSTEYDRIQLGVRIPAMSDFGH